MFSSLNKGGLGNSIPFLRHSVALVGPDFWWAQRVVYLFYTVNIGMPGPVATTSFYWFVCLNGAAGRNLQGHFEKHDSLVGYVNAHTHPS